MTKPVTFWTRSGESLAVIVIALILASCGSGDHDQDTSDPKGSDLVNGMGASDPYAVERATAANLDQDEETMLWQAPPSRWKEREKEIALVGLEYGNSSLLISPVQGGQNPFDPIERSLLTRLISDRISTTTDVTVSNPTFVFRYLGSHRPTYPLDDLMELAASTKAEEILLLSAGHDENSHFDFQASLVSKRTKEILKTRLWPGLSYSDSAPPAVAFEKILDEVVEFAVGASPKTQRSKSDFNPDDFLFPGSVEELINSPEKSAVYGAAYLQLIGMLHPGGSFNEARNGLFERSLVELQKIAPNSNYYRYFKARAYAYLDRRPAAIALLDKPANKHEKALLAALNGNLIALREEVGKMGTSALDFMSWRDLLDIESRYGDRKQRDILDRYIERNPVWAPFIYRALRDNAAWANYSAATAKLGLEAILPSDSATLESFLAKAGVTNDSPSELELTRLLLRSVEEIEHDNLGRWAADKTKNTRVSEIDILDLAKSIAVANHMRRIEDDLSKRALPKTALRRINDFDSLFVGHPAITLQMARAKTALANESKGAENLSLHREAAETYLNGFAWTGQLTGDAIDTGRRLAIYLTDSPVGYKAQSPQRLRRATRSNEWPKGAEWYRRITKQEVENGALIRCIDYSWTSFSCLKAHIEDLAKKPNASASIQADLVAKYADRYVGHPQRVELEIDAARAGGDGNAEIRRLRALIQAGSKNWPAYYSLGRALKRRGDYQAAQEVFLSYPGFWSTSRDVALANSNYANNAGSMLYWIGQYELALPLLEISANSGTGSSASMSAGNRVSLINGDLEAAQDWTAARVRRYGSKYAIRDLQQLLHIRGQSDSAWSLFDQALSITQDAQTWSGALVGHRLSAATTADVVDWLEASKSRRRATMWVDAPREQMWLAPRYLLLAGTADRLPGPELARAIAQYRTAEPPTFYRGDQSNTDDSESAIEPAGFVLESGRTLKHDDLIPTPRGGQKARSGQVIETRFEMLARAMGAFLREDYPKSFEIFNETAYYYYLDEYLPYYAFSGAVLGKAAHLPLALRSREAGFEKIRLAESASSSELGYRFDEDLTYAVLAAFDGRHEESIHYLSDALNNRPYLEERTVYPYYQIVDLADRLFERTEVELYRDFALDLAKRHTVVLPMYSWAYFVVAKYSESSIEQLDAAASGLKLDPLSHRATLLPKTLIQQAKDYLADHDAPYLRRTAEPTSFGT